MLGHVPQGPAALEKAAKTTTEMEKPSREKHFILRLQWFLSGPPGKDLVWTLSEERGLW